jgi:hypothetical protein
MVGVMLGWLEAKVVRFDVDRSRSQECLQGKGPVMSHEEHAKTGQDSGNALHRANRLWLIIVLLVAIFVAVTNPSHDRHKQAIKDVVNKKHFVLGPIGGAWAAGAITNYRSWVFCSYTTIGDNTATFGMLGYVWVDEEQF